MKSGVDVVDGSRACDECFCLFGSGATRVGKGGGGRLEPVQALDAGRIADHHQQNLAALLGRAQRLDHDAFRGPRQLAQVAVDRRRVGELARGAGQVAEIVGRRWHGGGLRQIGHPGTDEPRVGGEAGDGLDRARLRSVGSEGRPLGGESAGRKGQADGEGDSGNARAHAGLPNRWLRMGCPARGPDG